MKRERFYMLVMMLFLLLPNAMAHGNISLKFANESLRSVFNRLEKAYGYKILFTYNDVESYRVNGEVKKVSFQEAMTYVLADKPLAFHTNGKMVHVVKKQGGTKNPPARKNTYRGEVIENGTGYPIIGATVAIKGTKTKTVTNEDGTFTLDDCPENARLIVSYIGMKSREIGVANKFLRIALESES